MHSAPMFDFFKFNNILLKFDFSDIQAQGLTEAQQQIFSELFTEVIVTKVDIVHLENKMNNKFEHNKIVIEMTEFRLSDKIVLLETQFNRKFNQFEIIFNSKMSDIEARLFRRVDQLDNKITDVETRLTHRMDQLELNFDYKLNALENRLNAKIEQLVITFDIKLKEVNHRIEQLDTRLNTRIEQLDVKLSNKIDNVEHKFDRKFNLVYWLLGFLLSFNVAIFLKLLV